MTTPATPKDSPGTPGEGAREVARKLAEDYLVGAPVRPDRVTILEDMVTASLVTTTTGPKVDEK